MKSKPDSQRGAVLIVSLVILTVLTVIAVNMSTDIGLQANMARNTQLSQNVFNVAYSEINAQVVAIGQDQQPLVNAINANPTEFPVADGQHLMTAGLTAAGTNNFQQEFVFDYQEETEFLPDGFTADQFTGYLFNLDSTANIPQTGTSSDQTQGVTYAGPKQQ